MNKFAKRYLIDAMSGMAQGLFASLLVGTIIKTLGQQLLRLSVNPVFQFLVDAGSFCSEGHVVGAAMAIGIGYAMSVHNLVLFSLVTVGATANTLGGAGGPLAVLLIAIIAAELGMLVSKKTKVDILVTPLVTITGGVLLSVLCAKYIGVAASWVGNLIMLTTELHPFVMGILVSVIVGVALTLPISSAAICAALGLTGLAGGAAVAGCCAQMVGFAVLSFKENRWGGLVSQGLGTSMLQMPNIIKNPKVWIVPILVSAITGPFATCVFKMEMNGPAVSSGMGTCGLVGQIGVISGWYNPSEQAVKWANDKAEKLAVEAESADEKTDENAVLAGAENAAASEVVVESTGTEVSAESTTVSQLTAGDIAKNPGFVDWFGLLMVCIIMPGVLCWALGKLFRKIGWIKDGDLSLE